MYVAIIRFKEIDDGGHIYEIGDTYPRDGYKPTKKRAASLLGGNNKLGKPVIIEAESLFAAMTDEELTHHAHDLNIEIPEGASREDITALIETSGA